MPSGQRILEIKRNAEDSLKTAEEVEEMRPLENATMSLWASQAEERVSTNLKRQDPTVLSRKNTHVVVCSGVGGGA